MANPFERDWKEEAGKAEAEAPAARPADNRQGDLGPRCKGCSGAGVVMLTAFNKSEYQRVGGTKRCDRCLGTGVEPLTPLEQRELLGRLREQR